jgi:hypothetical protein
MNAQKPARGRCEQRRHKIANLPKRLREELERRLREEDYKSYRALSKWLEGEGYRISHAALQKYQVKFETQLQSIREATAQARAIVEASPDDDNQMAEALLRLVQTELFEVLWKLRGHQQAVAKSARGRNAPNLNVVVLGRTVAQLGRAAIAQRKWVEEERARLRSQVKAAKECVGEVQREMGLSKEAAEKIRGVLLGIEV